MRKGLDITTFFTQSINITSKTKIENALSFKEINKVCDKALNRGYSWKLPSHDYATSLSITFVDYFDNKVEPIRSW